MFAVEVYAAVRHFVFLEGNSRREAARVFGLSRETISKMCRFSLPPGYTRVRPIEKPKLGRLLPVIDAILDADRTAPVKQRHTAKRIFERLRDEHDFAGGYTVVKDYVRVRRTRGRETFVPLAHPPGHAQDRERYSSLLAEAGRDALTGAMNRNRLEAQARPAMDLALASGQGVSLVLVDLDGFGGFNRRHGQAGSDEALRRVKNIGRLRFRVARGETPHRSSRFRRGLEP